MYIDNVLTGTASTMTKRARLLLAAAATTCVSVQALASPTGSDLEVKLKDALVVVDESKIDSYDPSAGPYGGANRFPAPIISTGNTMPDFTAPSGYEAIEGTTNTDTQSYKGGRHTLRGHVLCDNFTVRSSTLTIEGDVIIIVDNAFIVRDEARIVLAEDASLTIYCKGSADVTDESRVNTDTSRPGDLTFYMLGDQDLSIKDESSLVATAYAPNASLRVYDEADFYGGLLAKSLYVVDEAAAHLCAVSTKPTTIKPLYD